MHFITHKPRFFYSLIFGLFTLSILQILNLPFNFIEKMLIAFNGYLWCYVLLILLMIKVTVSEKIKHVASIEDENTFFLISISLISSVLSFIGIALEFSKAHDLHGVSKLTHLFLPIITLLGVWVLIPALFAIHYAHLFYMKQSKSSALIKFPDEIKNPNYIDFFYFSMTIAVAAQTADVSVTSREGRKLVILQSTLAYIFNTTIVALGINIAAGLIN